MPRCFAGLSKTDAGPATGVAVASVQSASSQSAGGATRLPTWAIKPGANDQISPRCNERSLFLEVILVGKGIAGIEHLTLQGPRRAPCGRVETPQRFRVDRMACTGRSGRGGDPRRACFGSLSHRPSPLMVTARTRPK